MRVLALWSRALLSDLHCRARYREPGPICKRTKNSTEEQYVCRSNEFVQEVESARPTRGPRTEGLACFYQSLPHLALSKTISPLSLSLSCVRMRSMNSVLLFAAVFAAVIALVRTLQLAWEKTSKPRRCLAFCSLPCHLTPCEMTFSFFFFFFFSTSNV